MGVYIRILIAISKSVICTGHHTGNAWPVKKTPQRPSHKVEYSPQQIYDLMINEAPQQHKTKT